MLHNGKFYVSYNEILDTNGKYKFNFSFDVVKMKRFGAPLQNDFVGNTTVIYYSPTYDKPLAKPISENKNFIDISSSHLSRANKIDVGVAPEFGRSSDIDLMLTKDTFKLLLLLIYCNKQQFKFPDAAKLPSRIMIELYIYNPKDKDRRIIKLIKTQSEHFELLIGYFLFRIYGKDNGIINKLDISTIEDVKKLINYNIHRDGNLFSNLVLLYHSHNLLYNNQNEGIRGREEIMRFSIKTSAINEQILASLFNYYFHEEMLFLSFSTLMMGEQKVNNAVKISFPMSSGELSFYSLFARILGTLFMKQGETHIKADNYNLIHKEYDGQSILLILDEPDLSMHPEWQQNFIFLLTYMLENLFRYVKFQIIVSSHSPIMISDIPKSNVIFLKYNKIDGLCSVCNGVDQKQTFGANIHTLFKNSFFLNGLPIGLFAKKKIQELYEQIDGGKIEESIIDEIDMVGEPLIKADLMRHLDVKRKDLNKELRRRLLMKELKELNNDQDTDR